MLSANSRRSLAALAVLLAATDQQVGPIAPIPALPTSLPWRTLEPCEAFEQLQVQALLYQLKDLRLTIEFVV